MQPLALAPGHSQSAPVATADAFRTGLIGDAPELWRALELARRAARTRCTVLVRGETGTGKELVARAIHASSPRAAAAFVAVNCAAIPETLLEAELFGHVKGAFTGATTTRQGRIPAAHGGTLFLDEVGELPLAAQAKLLRVLQSRSYVPVGADREVAVDVRVVAATHRNLEEMVAEGTFREDLYYRLGVIQVSVPALRERGGDVLGLALHFLHRANSEFGTGVSGFTDEAVARMCAYNWPGNVRELENVVERATLIRQDGPIDAVDLEFASCGTAATEGLSVGENLNLKDAVKRLEHTYIENALERTGGNRTEAAALLGLNRTTLVEKMRRLRSA